MVHQTSPSSLCRYVAWQHRDNIIMLSNTVELLPSEYEALS